MSAPRDWDSLGFALNPTAHMFVAETDSTQGAWPAGSLRPFGDLTISPAAGVLNYGQGIFEGLKAMRNQQGEILLFRPWENAKRFQQGAESLCMPAVPMDYFLQAITAVVKANHQFVPPYGKGSLYLRPCLWGTGEILGVGPAPAYTFVVYASPVGAYYKQGLKPIRVLVSDDYHRAAPLGVGHVKCIGNYAGTLLSLKAAKAQGYEGCVYLDAKHSRYVEEVGTANFFCIQDGVLYTPKLGSILPGITRDSIIHLAKTEFQMPVQEIDIPVEQVQRADEAFCVGTAAVVTPIGAIAYRDQITTFQGGAVGPLTQRFYARLTAIQQGDAPDPFAWVMKVD